MNVVTKKARHKWWRPVGHTKGHHCVTTVPLQMSCLCKLDKVTVQFRVPSLEEPDNELFRFASAHHKFGPASKRRWGNCIPQWVVFITSDDMSIFHLIIETLIIALRHYIVMLFYFYLLGIRLTAAHVSFH